MSFLSKNRNINLSYILTYLNHSYFWLGTWIFFYLQFTDYAGIGLIESIVIILSIVLEIPTGVLADTIGKRKTLMIAFLLSGIGNLVFGFSNSFPMLILSVCTFVFGTACYSGTLEALQYDSLKDVGEEGKFGKVTANTNTIMLISFAISSVIGGFLYKILPGLPFLLLGTFQIIGIYFVFLLKEPEHDTEKASIAKFFKDQLEGFRQLNKTNQIRSQTFLLVGTGLFMVMASQVLNDALGVEIGFEPYQFGLIAAGMYLLASLSSQLVPVINKKITGIGILVLSTLFISITFIVSPLLGFATGALALSIRWSMQSIFDGATSIIVNQNIESKFRATTISTLTLIKNIPYAFAAYFLGSVMENANVRSFNLWVGLSLLAVLTVTYIHERSTRTS